MDATLRTAGNEDLASLEALLAAQLQEHEIPVDATRLARTIRAVLAAPERGFFLLALAPGGKALGVAYVPFLWSLEHEGLVAWLEELYVLPSHRGNGLGGALVRAVCTEAAARGCQAVDLEVDAGHERAARLYVREGFQPLQRDRWVRRLREA